MRTSPCLHVTKSSLRCIQDGPSIRPHQLTFSSRQPGQGGCSHPHCLHEQTDAWRRPGGFSNCQRSNRQCVFFIRTHGRYLNQDQSEPKPSSEPHAELSPGRHLLFCLVTSDFYFVPTSKKRRRKKKKIIPPRTSMAPRLVKLGADPGVGNILLGRWRVPTNAAAKSLGPRIPLR